MVMKTLGRLFIGTFGVFLFCIGIYAIVDGAPSLAWRLLGGGVLCVLGAEALYSALVDRKPWISAIALLWP